MTAQDLIQQYATTGNPIPKYQYDKLSYNVKKSYLRQRFLAATQHTKYHIEDYELLGLPADDAKILARSLTDINSATILQNTTETEQILNILPANGVNAFKKRSGSPHFENTRGVRFIFDTLNNKSNPEQILNLFTADEKTIIGRELIKTAIYVDVLQQSIEPIKIFKLLDVLELVTNLTKTELDKRDAYQILQNNINPNDVLVLLNKKIKTDKLELDSNDLNILYSNSKNPEEIYKLTNHKSLELDQYDIIYMFARSKTLLQYINILKRMNNDIQKVMYLKLDDYSIRRIMTNLRSIENFDIFIDMMGNKLINTMKDFSDRDWDFILYHQDKNNTKVMNKILNFKQQYS